MKAICASVNLDLFMVLPRPTARIAHAAKLEFSSKDRSENREAGHGGCASVAGGAGRRSAAGHAANAGTNTSSGLYRFLAIAVLLDVKDIPQVGPLQWGWIRASTQVRSCFFGLSFE